MQVYLQDQVLSSQREIEKVDKRFSFPAEKKRLFIFMLTRETSVA